MNNIPKDKKISLSSWNYGSFSLTNPYYNVYPIKAFKDQFSNKNNNNIIKPKQTNEKIVENEYIKNMDYMYYISREHDKIKQREKSAMNKINKDKANKEFQKTFSEWKKEKNKKIREEKIKKKINEEIKRDISNYCRITFKEWNKRKTKEIKRKKKIEEEGKKYKKEYEEERDKIRKENMNNWTEKKEKIKKVKNKIMKIKMKELEKTNEEMKIKKEEICKQNFREWIMKKNKENKKNKNKIKDEEEKNNKYVKRKNSEVIGPYSYAKALRKMQNFYNGINDKNNMKRCNTAKK